jgi:hypothetical protein
VTESPDQNAPDSHQPRPGEQSFRDELLRDMAGGECLSLSDIDSRVQYDYRTEPLSTRQSRVITAVASLLTEGWRSSARSSEAATRLSTHGSYRRRMQ